MLDAGVPRRVVSVAVDIEFEKSKLALAVGCQQMRGGQVESGEGTL